MLEVMVHDGGDVEIPLSRHLPPVRRTQDVHASQLPGSDLVATCRGHEGGLSEVFSSATSRLLLSIDMALVTV